MSERSPEEIEQLAQAMKLFTATTEKMEVAYRALEERSKALDAELAEKNQELQVTSDYLLSLLESMSDGVIAVDEAGVITRMNRAASQILGFQQAEVAGKDFESVFQRAFSVSLPEGTSELAGKSGRKVPVSERNSPIADGDGNQLGMVKTFQDLSELKALREQVRQTDRLAAVGEMAASVAHEIRNPLGGLRGFASLLAEDIADEDPKGRLVEKILKGTQRLDKVVSELLEFTRPVSLEMKPGSCRELVEAAIAYLSYDAEHLVIENRVDESVRALMDASKMEQVILNILVNASQCMDGQGHVLISSEATDQYVRIQIADEGPGMDEEAMAQVFSPFYTTKEKGSGLGMAISEKIVTGHGGEISVESVLGKGSRFTVQLPRAE